MDPWITSRFFLWHLLLLLNMQGICSICWSLWTCKAKIAKDVSWKSECFRSFGKILLIYTLIGRYQHAILALEQDTYVLFDHLSLFAFKSSQLWLLKPVVFIWLVLELVLCPSMLSFFGCWHKLLLMQNFWNKNFHVVFKFH